MLCFSAFENLDDKKSSLSLYSREHTLNDIDSISLTTDDLLRLPADDHFLSLILDQAMELARKARNALEDSIHQSVKRIKIFKNPPLSWAKIT